MNHYNSRTGRSEASTRTCDAIRRNLPFKSSTGSLWAVRGGSLRYGNQLNQVESDEFRRVEQEIVYTLLSYSTPIAYCYRALADGSLPGPRRAADQYLWHVVDQKFSVSTSRHQTLLHAALSGRFGDFSKTAFPIEYTGF